VQDIAVALLCEVYVRALTHRLRALTQRSRLCSISLYVPPPAVIDVHARDVMLRLVEDAVSNAADFAWTRYA
jgi:hypothetical protein